MLSRFSGFGTVGNMKNLLLICFFSVSFLTGSTAQLSNFLSFLQSKTAGTSLTDVLKDISSLKIGTPATTVLQTLSGLTSNNPNPFAFRGYDTEVHDGRFVKVSKITQLSLLDAQKQSVYEGGYLLQGDPLTKDLDSLNKLAGCKSVSGKCFFIGGSTCLRSSADLQSSSKSGGVCQDDLKLFQSAIQQSGKKCVLKNGSGSGCIDIPLLSCGSGTPGSQAETMAFVACFGNFVPVIKLVDPSIPQYFISEIANYTELPSSEVILSPPFSYNKGSSSGDKECSDSYNKDVAAKRISGSQVLNPIACICSEVNNPGGSKIVSGQGTSKAKFTAGQQCEIQYNKCQLECTQFCTDYQMQVASINAAVVKCSTFQSSCPDDKPVCNDAPTGAFCQKQQVVLPSTYDIWDSETCRTAAGQIVRMARCTSSGDPHLITFDKCAYSFQGKCCYTAVMLVQPIEVIRVFQVIVCHEYRGTNTQVTWIKSVTIIYNDKRFTFDNTGTFKNPYKSDDVQVFVKRDCSGRYQYTFLSTTCLKVAYDGISKLDILLNKALFNGVMGLCGNFDGDCANEYIPRNGTKPVSTLEFGNSFLVYDQSAKQDCGGTELLPCTADQLKICSDIKQCGALNPDPSNANGVFYKATNCANNKASLQVMGFQFRECLLDCCNFHPSNNDNRCAAFNDFEKYILNTFGFILPWREAVGCGQDCSKIANSAFVNSASKCENTCEKPYAEANCDSQAKVSRCVCTNGTVRHRNGNCVDFDDCRQCTAALDPHDEKSAETIIDCGEEYVAVPCGYKIICNKYGQFDYVPLPQCSPNAACVNNTCVCVEGYVGNGTTCVKSKGSSCPDGWFEWNGKCLKRLTVLVSWYQAVRGCCALGAQLFRVDTDDEVRLSKDLFAKFPDGRIVNAHMAGNTDIVPPAAQGKCSNRPANSYFPPKAIVTAVNSKTGCFYINDGEIDIGNCYELRQTLCYFENPYTDDETAASQGDVYQYIGKSDSYIDSLAECKARGATLPLPKTREQVAALTKLQNNLNIPFCRVGLFGDGKIFKWLDNDIILPFWNPDGKEPNNVDTDRSVVNDGNGNGFRTRNVNDNYPIICQMPSEY